VPEELEAWAKDHSEFVLTHSVPKASIKLAYTQQITTRQHAKDADIVLSVINTGPIKLPVPQIIWACNVIHFVPGNSLVARAQNWTVLKAMDYSDMCIFPSESARDMAIKAGFNKKSKVLYHPMRTSSERWYKSNQTDKLNIFVPASNNTHKNLAILPEVSKLLTDRGVAHNLNLTIEQHLAAAELKSQPSIKEMGMPVAASNIPVHTEISQSAHLFNPTSALDAANAIVTAASQTPPADKSSEFISQPSDYASEVHTLVQELLKTTG